MRKVIRGINVSILCLLMLVSIAFTQSKSSCSSLGPYIMPRTIAVQDQVFEEYLRFSRLAWNVRGKSFSEFSNSQKASASRLHYALQIIKNAGLSKGQTDFLVDAISAISPEIYDRDNQTKAIETRITSEELERRALQLFEKQQAMAITAGGVLGDKSQEIALLQSYQELIEKAPYIGDRKKLLKSMPLETEVNIWKVEMAYHLVTAKITKGQRQFIVEMMQAVEENLDPKSRRSKEEAATYFKNLRERIYQWFTPEESFAIFENIGLHRDGSFLPRFSSGPNPPPFVLQSVTFLPVKQSFDLGIKPKAMLVPETNSKRKASEHCECISWCPPRLGQNQVCGAQQGPCVPLNVCGPYWNEPCTAWCSPAQLG